MLKMLALLLIVAIASAKKGGDVCGGQHASCDPVRQDGKYCFCTNEHKCKARSGYPANVNCETGQAAARSEYANQYFSDYYYDDDMEDDIDDEMLYEEAWENLEKAQEEFEMAKRLLRGRQVRGGRRNNFRGYGY